MLLCSHSVSPCAAELREVSLKNLVSPCRGAAGQVLRDLNADEPAKFALSGPRFACKVRINWMGVK